MKKCVSILVLALMLYNIMGYYLAYLAMVQQTKEEMRETLADNDETQDLIVVKLPYVNGKIEQKDFELIDEDEFRLDGKMYDIARTEIRDNSIYFYCLNDKKEDAINFALAKQIQNDTNDNSSAEKRSNSIAKNLAKLYLPTAGLRGSFSSSENESTYAICTFQTLNAIYDVASPPPKSI